MINLQLLENLLFQKILIAIAVPTKRRSRDFPQSPIIVDVLLPLILDTKKAGH